MKNRVIDLEIINKYFLNINKQFVFNAYLGQHRYYAVFIFITIIKRCVIFIIISNAYIASRILFRLFLLLFMSFFSFYCM